MILFCNDYQEGCHPLILQRLSESNLCQTIGYGEDEYCSRARELVKKACGRDDADVHFLVGGTQTNATVIASVLKPYQGVVCPTTGHINVHETGAIEHCGHKVLAVPSANGKISSVSLDAVLEAHFNEDGPEHGVQPGLLYISFPTELGTLYSLEELRSLRIVCDKWGIPMFIDGARLGYGLASSSCDLTLKDIAAIADVFYIGGTKQGALFGEAVVVSNEALKKDFRYYMKQHGAMLAKGRLLGIQFGALFEDGLYFSIARNAILQAERIVGTLKEKGYEFFVDSPTNQIFPVFPSFLVASLEKAGIIVKPWEHLSDGRVAVRICTSWATTDDNVEKLISLL